MDSVWSSGVLPLEAWEGSCWSALASCLTAEGRMMGEEASGAGPPQVHQPSSPGPSVKRALIPFCFRRFQWWGSGYC